MVGGSKVAKTVKVAINALYKQVGVYEKMSKDCNKNPYLFGKRHRQKENKKKYEEWNRND